MPTLWSPLSAVLLVLPSPQDPIPIAYPQRDALSPFRAPAEQYAPPDEIFRVLRGMQQLADAPDASKSFDDQGREVVDSPRWREYRQQLAKLDLQAGYLIQIIRLHRNAADRATAFYGGFFVDNVGHAIEVIEHIPGEPERRIREAMLPRAVAFLQAQLRRRFGDLDAEQQAAVRQNLPEPGSPAAHSLGIRRGPLPMDHLFTLRIVPFLQLLDQPEPLVQAQAMWFLKSVFALRPDLALVWLEPALPRVRQLLLADHGEVRREAIGLLQSIGPTDLRVPPTDGGDALLAWADEAQRWLFPPVRNINDTIVQLHPSAERDLIARAGAAALRTSAIGDPYRGQRKDGSWFSGYRIARVPEELQPLAIPRDAVITLVNGIAVRDAATLLAAVRSQLAGTETPRQLFVEYVLNGEDHAVEYRVM